MATLQIWLVFWPGFFLGILHTLLPCEDKAIFFFYTFGASRDSKEAFRILTVYGLGLLCANMIFGTIAAFGGLIFGGLNQHVTNGLGATSIIVSGIIMIVQVSQKRFRPHSQQGEEISETFQQRNGRFRKKTAFLLGILAGIPPCVFELAIYTQALTFSASSGVINGIAVVFFFGIGTWIGLFPLAAFGLIGPAARTIIEKRNQGSLHKKDSDSKDKDSVVNLKKSLSPKIEIISASIMIIIGIVLLVLAFAEINIFKWPEVPIV